MPQTLTNVKPVTLEKLWQAQPVSFGALPPGDAPFDPEALTALPLLARRYLRWAIVRDWPKGANVPGTPIASAVRLQMHGTIKLGNKWHRFTGEEVIRWQRGMIWRATTWMQGLPIFGADRLVDGVCDVRWKLLGLLPMMQASGADVARSGAITTTAPLRATPFSPAFGPGGSLAATGLRARVSSFAAPLIEPAIADR
ncbi:MAG: DUF6544 family protein [Nodosilinea sp.]